MTQLQPKITIGLTCFNAADTIERAVRSALEQDWQNLEICVVDDASTDESAVLLDKAFKGHPQVRIIIHEENKGYPSALNTLVEQANGEFIAFFDDDDESAPDRLSKQYKRLIRYEEEAGTTDVLCYTNRMVVKATGQNEMKAIGHAPKEPHGAMVADFLLWHYEEPGYKWGQFGSCTLMARVGTFRKYGGFDPEFRRMAEWDFAIRLAQKGGHFIAVNEPLVTQHITQTSDKGGKIPLQYGLRLRFKHKEYLKSQRVYLSSLLIAYSRFHYAKSHIWKSRVYLLLACLASPFRVFVNELEKRLKRNKAKGAE
jgi:glycosyltransferase involved in cell wall biosynthesis